MRSLSLIVTGLLAVYSVAIGLLLVSMLNGSAEDVAARIAGERGGDPAPGGTGEAIEVEISSGTSAEAIARQLAEVGVIHDRETLSVLMALTGTAGELQTGRYEFTAGMSVSEVLRRLRAGPDLVQVITFREGLRVEEIGLILEREGIASVAEWEEALAQPPLERHAGLLEQRPEGADLTGYLMPATYELEAETTALDLLHAMLDAFMERVTPDLIAEAEAQGLTLHEVLTLASIVEREAVHGDEEPIVASVFRNRLEIGMPLQADPTVQYAITIGPEGAASIEEHGYWKLELTIWDLEVDSPYNTYVYAGLPPGPIANPGFGAIRATVYPDETPYLYFVAHPDCDGRHLFAEDLPQHEVNVQLFRASDCATPGVAPASPLNGNE